MLQPIQQTFSKGTSGILQNGNIKLPRTFLWKLLAYLKILPDVYQEHEDAIDRKEMYNCLECHLAIELYYTTMSS